MGENDSITRVYKFLEEKWALEDIKKRRIKISEIHDLNDPFELIAFDLSDAQLRKALLTARDQMNKRGVLCFSQDWKSPLLWAHYADKQQGIVEKGDIEEALNAASAVGDDNIQKQTRGTIVPDAFTHGTSEQRRTWFYNGYNFGDLEHGNTFDADL